MSETTQFIEAEGVPQLFELNLLTAEHEEAWMEFLEHASQKNGQLADRWNTEWCARKERYEKRDQEILDLPLSNHCGFTSLSRLCATFTERWNPPM